MKEAVKSKLMVIGKIVCLWTFLFYFLCNENTHFAGIPANKDITPVQKISNRGYFTLTVLSTVGFGDISPYTPRCKVLSSALLIVILVQLIDLLT